MKLAYEAVDRTGERSSDTIEAQSTAEATEKLRQRGLFVTSIGESRAAPVATTRDRRQGGVKTLKDLAIWSRQLCVLVRSGTPVAEALVAIEHQTKAGPWHDVLVRLRRQVEEGCSLSEAMSHNTSHFDEVTRSLIAAGESSGQLGPMLDRAATLIRQQLRTRRALVGAMVYPALLVCVGFVVTLVMLLGVLPRFSELFESMNAALPPTTRILMAVSEALRAWWWAMLGGVFVTGVTLKLVFSGANGRRLLDQWLLRLPQIGPMLKSLATARIARLLGVMLHSKVPMLEALQLTQHSTGNVIYADLVRRAVDAATHGEQISSVFSSSPLISPSVAEALRHGEKNGQIGPILTDMADFLDEENEVIVKTTMSLIEPLILILLGVIVGFIALSMFIPLFDLASMAGGS